LAREVRSYFTGLLSLRATHSRPVGPLARAVAFAVVALMSFGSNGWAATVYWDGTTGNWNDLTKWSTDLAGTTNPTSVPLTTADTLNFNTTPGAALTSTLYLNSTRGASSLLATMNFNATGATTLLGGVSGTPASNDLYVSTFTVNAGSGAVTIGDTAVTPTASVNLKAGSISFTNSSSSLLTLANGINSYGGSGTTTFTFTGSGNIKAGGVIGNGTGSNVVALTKSGSTGTMTLSGFAVNTFTGGVAVNGGTLLLDFANLATPTNLVNSANTLTLGGGTLSVKGKSSGTTAQTLANPTLTASTASSIVLNPNGGTSTTLTLGNTWTRNTNSSLLIDLSAGGALTSSPTLTNSVLGYAIVKDATSSGFATVSGGNVVRYTGATILSDNSDSSTTNYSYSGSGATLNWSNGITNRSVNSLAIDTSGGTATIDMGGASNVLTLTTGGLLMTGSNNAIIQNGVVGASVSEVIVNQFGAGTLTISGAVSGGAGTLIKTGTGKLILSGVNSFTGATRIEAGTLEIGGAGQLNSGSYAGTIANKGSLIYNSSAAQILNGAISGIGSVVKSGAGTLTLSGSNTFTGGLTISAGTVKFTLTNNLGSGNVVIGGSGDTVIDNAGVNQTVANITGWTLTGTGTITRANSGAAGIGWGIAKITGSSGGLIYTGVAAGTQVGAVTSDYTGGTTLTSGTIIMNGTNDGDTSTAGTFGNGSVASNVVTFNGASLRGGTSTATRTIYNNISFAADTTLAATSGGAAGTLTWAGEVTLNGSGTRTLTQASATQNWVFSNTIKNGTVSDFTVGITAAKSVTLSGANTFSGTLLASGTGGGSLALGNVNAVQNATLDTGTATASRAVTFTVAGINNTYNIGALQGADDLDIGGNTISVGSKVADTAFTGIISGSGGALTKVGGNTLTLSGANTYTGATQVNGGILNFANTSAKSSSTTVTAAAAGTVGLGVGETVYYSATNVSDLFNTNTLAGFNMDTSSGVAIDTTNATAGTFDQTTALTGSRALTKLGTGTLTLSQANTYTGATTVSAGTLSAGATNALQSTTAVTVTGGSLLVGVSNAINDSAEVTLNGGKIEMASSGGISENVGALTLTANSIIDFGTTGSANALAFLASNSKDWSTFTLTINNWTAASAVDTLRFGTTSSGLTGDQLSKITSVRF